MIESIFILNNKGKCRFSKIYSHEEITEPIEDLIKRLFDVISLTKDSSIIYDFPYFKSRPEDPRRIYFRTYGSIYIVFICDDLENELAILDFINVMMIVLDEVFKGISESHIINSPEKIHYLVDEMITGGIVIETNKNEIINSYRELLNSK